MKPQLLARIKRLYLRGQSSLKIADTLGTSSASVLRALVSLGVKRRAPNYALGKLRGKDHPLWGTHRPAHVRAAVSAANRAKGGERHLTTDGYWAVQSPGHPFARSDGCVLEHRLVMERVLGRYLLPSEVVHHENEDKVDNRPTNLKLLASRSAHSREHSKWEAARAVIEPVFRKLTPAEAARQFGTHVGTMCQLYDRWGIPRAKR